MPISILPDASNAAADLHRGKFVEFLSVVSASFDCPMTMISIGRDDRAPLILSYGFDAFDPELPLALHAFARSPEPASVLCDTRDDASWIASPYVDDPPHVRFHASVAMRMNCRSGENADATLSIFDQRPRGFTPNQIDRLRDFAKIAEVLVDAEDAQDLAGAAGVLIRDLGQMRTQFRQAERMANVGYWRLNLVDETIEWSDQVFAIHELEKGRTPTFEDALSFYPPQARTLVSAALSRSIATGEPYEVETDFITALGNLRRVRSKGELEIVGGKKAALSGVFQDFTEQYLMSQELRRDARIDALTGLPNRVWFNETLPRCMADAWDGQLPLALILIDLDRFKEVNDTFGHDTGDSLLQLLASRLKAPYLANCFVARLGGDEFVIILSRAEDTAAAANIVERLLRDLNHRIETAAGTVEVTATLGLSWLDASVADQRELLRRADKALYEAKRTRRGSAQTFVRSALIDG